MKHYLGDKYYDHHPEESVLKPLTPLCAAIQAASPLDLLLLTIALGKQKEKEETGLTNQNDSVTVAP